MSWSVNAIGKPAAVKTLLQGQFASAKNSTKNIPAELSTVEATEAMVNAQLDFAVLNGVGAVDVQASGSASMKGATYSGSISSSVSFKSLYNFAE